MRLIDVAFAALMAAWAVFLLWPGSTSTDEATGTLLGPNEAETYWEGGADTTDDDDDTDDDTDTDDDDQLLDTPPSMTVLQNSAVIRLNNKEEEDEVPPPIRAESGSHDATLPGQHFPEVQGKAVEQLEVDPSITSVEKTAVARSKVEHDRRGMRRFPTEGGCLPSSGNHCINFGGIDGFPYDAATPAERAAFRAVIAQYARKGDSVTIRYLSDTESQLPTVAGQTKPACQLWARIDPTVDVPECTSNKDYIRTFIHDRNQAHHTALTDHLRRSWQTAGRVSARPSKVMPRLDPTFREKLLESSDSELVVGGGTSVPYLVALESALASDRLENLQELIAAVTNQCRMLAEREMLFNLDDIGDTAMKMETMRNYPYGTDDPGTRYYTSTMTDNGGDDDDKGGGAAWDVREFWGEGGASAAAEDEGSGGAGGGGTLS